MLSWLRDKVKTLQNKNPLLIGLTISFIALAFQMIGFVFPFWMSSNEGPYSVTAGLWQVCGMNDKSECLDIQVAGPGLLGKKKSRTRKKKLNTKGTKCRLLLNIHVYRKLNICV